MACVLCFAELSSSKSWDFNLINGKGGFDVINAIKQLDVIVNIRPTDKYICRDCLRLLKRVHSWRSKVKDLEVDIEQKHRSEAAKRGISIKTKSSKRALVFEPEEEEGPAVAEGCPQDYLGFHVLDSLAESPLSGKGGTEFVIPGSSFLATTPAKSFIVVKGSSCSVPKKGYPSAASTPAPQVREKEPVQSTSSNVKPEALVDEKSKTKVFIKVSWSSVTKEKQLPVDLASIGSMLLRGTYRQVASAVWRNKDLRAHLIEIFLKEIDKECQALCQCKDKPDDSKRAAKILQYRPSKKQRSQHKSCLRLTKKEDITSFTLEKFNDELQERAPLTRN
eukprot:gene1148-513_t